MKTFTDVANAPRPLAGHGVRHALVVYGASRAATLFIAWLAAQLMRVGTLDVLGKWDASWFRTVLAQGYPSEVPMVDGHPLPSTIPFFPLYPMVVKVVSWVLPGPDVFAQIAVSLALGALSAVLVHRLAEIVAGRQIAHRAVILYCLFPGSLVLSMGYSEGLMIILATACLIALLREGWVMAGVLAGLATASRATALVLVLVCLWQALTVVRRDRTWRPLIAPALAPTGAVAFMAFLWLRTGDPLAYSHAQAAWEVRPNFGRVMFQFVLDFLSAPLAKPVVTIAVCSLIFAGVSVVLLIRRQWPPLLSVYAISLLLFSVISRSDGLRPRDVLTAIPLLIAVAAGVSDRSFRRIATASACLLMASMVFHGIGAWSQP